MLESCFRNSGDALKIGMCTKERGRWAGACRLEATQNIKLIFFFNIGYIKSYNICSSVDAFPTSTSQLHIGPPCDTHIINILSRCTSSPDHRKLRSVLRGSRLKWVGLIRPQTFAMAAAVWTVRARKAVLGTATRSTSSHTALKSQYDALVIGGGEMCCWEKCREQRS